MNTLCYCVSVFLKASYSSSEINAPLWEEKIYLIHATSESEAKEIAWRIAKDSEVTYKNNEGELVSWKCEQVERVQEIEDFDHTQNIEIFSRFLKNSEAVSLLKNID